MRPPAVVIPARNELQNVPALAEALHRLRDKHHIGRAVLVDNGSTDGTAQAAAEMGLEVVHEPRAGYGRACLAGLAVLAEDPPDAVAFLDADLADDPAEIPRLTHALHHHGSGMDLVLGSRPALAEPGALDPHQRFGNRLACGLMRRGCGVPYHDMGPLRVIRWDMLQRLEMSDPTWGWTMEMQWKAATRGLRVLELDVPYRRRRAGRSKISGSLRGSLRAGAKILAIASRLWLLERRRLKHGANPGIGGGPDTEGVSHSAHT